MASSTLLIYGVTGYTGALVSNHATGRGIRHVAAGRDAKKVAAHAASADLPTRVFDLDSQAAIHSALRGVGAVLNCAGPFSFTAQPLAKACAKLGIHYLDLAGEWPEIATTAALDEAARTSGALLMPAVGFGVVATDCLALRVVRRLREGGKVPVHVDVAFSTSGGVSRGTLGTVLRDLRTDGARLRDGKRVPAKPAEESREVDFGDGELEDRATALLNPWRGDLATVEQTTGVNNADAWWAPPAFAEWMTTSQGAMSNLALGTLRKIAGLLPKGPSEKALAKGTCRAWAQVRSRDGSEARASLRGPDAYLLTAATAVEAARRAAAGDVPAGFHTAAEVWDAQFVEQFDGVRVYDLPSDVS